MIFITLRQKPKFYFREIARLQVWKKTSMSRPVEGVTEYLWYVAVN